MSAHATKSPSKFHRIRLCPGSHREEAKYPDSPSGKGAIDGTHTHTLLERCMTFGVEPISFINQTMADHDGEFMVDGERCNRVKVATDYIARRHAEIGGFVKSEMKLRSADAFDRDDMGGSCDIVIVGESVLEVIDYKDGMGEVLLPCDQIDLYSIMALFLYFNVETMSRIKIIRQTIIQPKLAYRGSNGIISLDMPLQAVLDLMPRYKDAAALADTPDAPLIPGESQCKYCKHKGACSALAGDMMEKSGVVFDNLDVAKQAADKDPATLSNEKIRELLEAAPLLRQLLDAVEAEALRRMESGITIEGVKVVNGRGSRSWTYPEDQMVEKLKKFGIPKDALWKTKLISPAQAEKVVWTKRDGSAKQLTDRQLKLMDDEYVSKSSGALTVALASDPRPAVVVSAVALFDAVPVVPEIPSWMIG